MARNHKPEEIIGKLRETEIVLAQGDGCGCIVARHVWTARRVQVDGGKIWRRFDCGHVSGLLMRHHGRRPRWVPRMAFQNNQPALRCLCRALDVCHSSARPIAIFSYRSCLLSTGSQSGSYRLSPVYLTTCHHRPDNPGDLVSQSHRRDFARPTLQQLQ